MSGKNSEGDFERSDSPEISRSGNKIMPKKGNLLLFDGSKKHASGHPIESLKRCVINFNLSK